jgi:hypothetical protein
VKGRASGVRLSPSGCLCVSSFAARKDDEKRSGAEEWEFCVRRKSEYWLKPEAESRTPASQFASFHSFCNALRKSLLALERRNS